MDCKSDLQSMHIFEGRVAAMAGAPIPHTFDLGGEREAFRSSPGAGVSGVCDGRAMVRRLPAERRSCSMSRTRGGSVQARYAARDRRLTASETFRKAQQPALRSDNPNSESRAFARSCLSPARAFPGPRMRGVIGNERAVLGRYQLRSFGRRRRRAIGR